MYHKTYVELKYGAFYLKNQVSAHRIVWLHLLGNTEKYSPSLQTNTENQPCPYCPTRKDNTGRQPFRKKECLCYDSSRDVR